jgi:hypothetical protein
MKRAGGRQSDPADRNDSRGSGRVRQAGPATAETGSPHTRWRLSKTAPSLNGYYVMQPRTIALEKHYARNTPIKPIFALSQSLTPLAKVARLRPATPATLTNCGPKQFIHRADETIWTKS